MKKKVISRLLAGFVIFSQICFAQSPLPQQMPPYYINNLSISNTNGIQLYQSENIISTGNVNEPVNISGTAKVDYKASKEVELKPGFTASDFTGDGEFHAYIEPLPFEVAWFEPTLTVGTVGKYEKLELGIKLPQDIQDKIQNFINCDYHNENCELRANAINPFDSAKISIDVDFFSPDNRTIHKYGFYFEDYKIVYGQGEDVTPGDMNDFIAYTTYPNNSYPDVNLSRWEKVPSDYNFRIRIAPDFIGYWTFNVKVWTGTSLLGEYFNGFFVAENELENGFVVKDANNKYLKFSDPVDPNNASLFLMGDNSPVLQDMIYPQHNQLNKDLLGAIFMNGGNFTEIMQIPSSLGIEHEDLGNYASVSYNHGADIPYIHQYGTFPGHQNYQVNRQVHAWEMDQRIEFIESQRKFCQIALDMPGTYRNGIMGQLFLEWDYFNDAHCGNPYNVNTPYNYNRTPGINNMLDFFDYENHPEALMYLKRKLRYTSARWGYSPHVISYEVHGELNNNAYEGINYNDESQRVIINKWANKVCEYIKVWLKDPHLLSVSMVGCDPNEEQPFSSDFIDFTDFSIYHYGYERDGNLNKADFATYVRSRFPKPILPGEYGNGNVNCNGSDISFHNEIWSTAMSGFFCSALSWLWHSNYLNNRYTNFYALSRFMDGVDFEGNNFSPYHDIITTSLAPNGNPTQDNRIEYFYLINEGRNKAMGWVHNRSSYWANDDNNCFFEIDPDDDPHTQNSIPYYCPSDDPDCSNVLNNTYIFDNPMEFFIGNIDEASEYQIQWYNTTTGEAIGQPENLDPYWVNWNVWKIPLPDFTHTFTDFAFKIWSGNEFKSLTTSDPKPNKTVRICMDSVFNATNYLHVNCSNPILFVNNIETEPNHIFVSPGTYDVKIICHLDTVNMTVIASDCNVNYIALLNEAKQKGINKTVLVENDKLINASIRVYPNPVTKHLTVEVDDVNAKHIVTFTDLLGKTIFTKEFNNSKYMFDMSFYAKGAYIISVTSGNSNYHQKIIVQ